MVFHSEYYDLVKFLQFYLNITPWMQEKVQRTNEELIDLYFDARGAKNEMIIDHFAFQFLEKKLWETQKEEIIEKFEDDL